VFLVKYNLLYLIIFEPYNTLLVNNNKLLKTSRNNNTNWTSLIWKIENLKCSNIWSFLRDDFIPQEDSMLDYLWWVAVKMQVHRVGDVAQWQSTCLTWMKPGFNPQHCKRKMQVHYTYCIKSSLDSVHKVRMNFMFILGSHP
jgi:hypothetical protein